MAGSTDEAARAFYELSKRLKAAEKGVRSELHKAVREAAKPLLPLVRAEARSRFPNRGGLAREMARASRYRAVVKTGAQTAGASIRANKTDKRVDTQGRVTHPVFGRPGKRVVQFVPSAVGFFSDTIEGQADTVRAEMAAILEKWATAHLGGRIGG